MAAAPGERKLAFQVVFASSEDTDYPATELNFHSPQTKGWQSSRFCDFPQEIGIAFVDGAVAVSQLQLLSHQSKIATRIELFVGTGDDYFHATFSRLGYLSLDSNERSDYKARELKSVYLKAKGSFMKLLLHRCYLNPHNLFNQVGLIAINALGAPVGGGGPVPVAAPGAPGAPGAPVAAAGLPMMSGAPSLAGSGVPKRAGAGAVHDLSVDMGLDPETAALLREVATRKDAAVAAEDYASAKRLKLLQDVIKGVGGRLASLVAEKGHAVEEEDYDRAAELKEEITRIRASIHEKMVEAGLRAGAGGAFGGGGGGYGGGRPPLAYAPPVASVDMRPIRPAAAAAAPPAASGAPVSPRGEDAYGGVSGSGGHDDGSGAEGAAAGGYGDEYPPAAIGIGGGGLRPGSRQIRPAAASALDEAMTAYERDPASSTGIAGIGPGVRSPIAARGGRGAFGGGSTSASGAGEDDGDASAYSSAASGGSRPARTTAARAAALAAADAAAGGADFGALGGGGASAGDGTTGGDDRADPAQLAGVEGAGDLPAPEPLSAAASKEAGPLVDLFGEYVARCYYSRQWNLREAAVAKMGVDLPRAVAPPASGGGGHAPSGALAAVLAVLTAVTAREKIAHVFVAAASKLLPALLATPAIMATLGGGGGRRGAAAGTSDGMFEPLLVGLVDRVGDNTPRIRDTAFAALLAIAQQGGLGPGLVAGHLMRKMSKKQAASTRSLQSRLQGLTDLIAKCGLLGAPGGGAVTPQMLVAYCVENGTFAHANGDIRGVTQDMFTAAAGALPNPLPLEALLAPHLRPKQRDEYHAAFVAAASGEGASGGAAAAAPPTAAAGPAPAARAGGRAPGAAGAPAGSGGARSGRSPAPTSRSAAAAPAAAAGEEEGDVDDGTCQFCGGCGPNATEAELDLHMWRDCPLLMACPQCTQVIEVATLHEHLLDECDHKDAMRPCPTCAAAVPAADLPAHTAERSCRPLPDPAVGNRCPLCVADIGPGKNGWLKHLLDEGCPSNPRKRGGGGGGGGDGTGGGDTR